jgi:hypothetical protein
MSDEHDHHDHAPEPPAPETRDAGSQALAEALRSSFTIVKIAMAALVIIIFAAGFFTVNPGEKAVILRFGKPVGEGQKMLLGSGTWYWSWPYPIDEVIRIPIAERQQVKSSVGWYSMTHEEEVAFETLGTEQPTFTQSLNPATEGYVITADRNIIHTRATVTYHIDDPLVAIFHFAAGTNHQFNLAGISNAVQDAANNALVATAARFNVDDILARDIGGFQDAVSQRINDLIEREHLGVVIDYPCQVVSRAPRQLADIFKQVTDGPCPSPIRPKPRASTSSNPCSPTPPRSRSCCRNTNATRGFTRNWRWPRPCRRFSPTPKKCFCRSAPMAKRAN